MPILSTEINFFKSSQGVGLGGPISGTQIATDTINAVFDNVNSQEAIAGDIEYRCIYVKNDNVSIDLLDTIIYILSNTSSPDTELAIGLDPAGVNASAAIIADESTAPAGVVFTAAADELSALNIGTLPRNGGYYAVWLRRTVSPNASAISEDASTLRVRGETTA